MLISKKDLLAETGISYGQLYRWKREGLIPEDWFIKQPSFTGQETFFPKSKILSRIKAIQELKDKYSLDELAKMLSPEVSERLFSEKDLGVIEEVEKGLIPLFCKVFGKDTFSFIEVLLIIAISKCRRDYPINYHDIENILNGIKDSIASIKQTDFMFVLLDKKGEYFVALHAENAQLFFDSRLEKVCQIRLNDISSMMKIKYRKSFNFKFDNEQEENEHPFEYQNGKVVQV